MSWRVNQLGESGNSLFAPFGQELAVYVCARKCQPHLRRRNKFDNPHTPPGASRTHSFSIMVNQPNNKKRCSATGPTADSTSLEKRFDLSLAESE